MQDYTESKSKLRKSISYEDKGLIPDYVKVTLYFIMFILCVALIGRIGGAW